MNDRLVFLVLVNCIAIPDRNPHSISPSFYQFVRESSPIVIPGTSGSENIIESGHCILEQRVFGKTDVCSIPISGVALNDFEIFRSGTSISVILKFFSMNQIIILLFRRILNRQFQCVIGKILASRIIFPPKVFLHLQPAILNRHLLRKFRVHGNIRIAESRGRDTDTITGGR